MGNVESSSQHQSAVPSPLPCEQVSDDTGPTTTTVSASPSVATLSTGSCDDEEEEVEDENDYYDDEDTTEETLLCSSLFSSRKNDPLLLHTSSEPPLDDDSSNSNSCSSSNNDGSPSTRSSTMKRSVSTLCYPSFGGSNSSTSSLPRSSSWTSGSSSTMADDYYYGYTLEELHVDNGDSPTEESNLRPSLAKGCRNFWIVTTAALPWMTGTAVNPLLRAAHLSQLNRPFATTTTTTTTAVSDEEDGTTTTTTTTTASTVTLVIPWLESPDERVQMYGSEWHSKTQSDQDAYIRTWLSDRAGLPLEADVTQGGIDIVFYPARLHPSMNSIFAMGDICSMIPSDKADVCFLEEPEHLNWYRAPGKDWWTEKFTHVVGVGHTNYKAYVPPLVFPPIVGTISSLMVRAYCHKLIKLSPVLQTFAPDKETVSNVHGIRSEFLHEESGDTCHDKDGIYFIGKLLWAKGFDKLIELQSQYRKVYGDYFAIDIVGSGPEQDEIQRAFQGRVARTEHNNSNPSTTSSIVMAGAADFPKSRYEFRKDSIPANFVGRRDHASCRSYKIFVNPSISEVLCTTTAEAISMGKFVLVPVHPSNTFFAQFPNCLQYHSKKEFVTLLKYAMTHDPEPLTPELKHELTWEAATERCLQAAAITRRDAARRERIGNTKFDRKIAKLHYELGKGKKGDVIRKFLGGGPVSDQVHYEMTVKEVGGDALEDVPTECAQ